MGNEIYLDKEVHIKNHSNSMSKEQIKKINELIDKCICKINNGNNIGTGFFCKILLNDNLTFLPLLITCNHVLDQMSVSDGKNINLNYKDVDYSLLIDKSRIVYTNKLEDITIIEIKGNDPINIQIFLEIDD